MAATALKATLAELGPELRSHLQYAGEEGGIPGISAFDALDTAGDEHVTYLAKLDYEKAPHIRPYLNSVGTALGTVGNLCGKQKAGPRKMPLPAKQKVFMALDVLSGILIYGATFLTGEHDEETRRQFLMTRGQKSVSARRAQQVIRRANLYRELNILGGKGGMGGF